MKVIGIDPGLSGALALVGSRGLEAVADMPIMQRGVSRRTIRVRRKGQEPEERKVEITVNQVNGAALIQLLKEWTSGHDLIEFLVVLEHQAPFRIPGQKPQGASSVFSLGHTTGTVETAVVACRLPTVEITPQAWKKAFKIPGGKEHKGKARSLAQRYYPEAELSRVKDHNRAEAILIARYGYQEHG